MKMMPIILCLLDHQQPEHLSCSLIEITYIKTKGNKFTQCIEQIQLLQQKLMHTSNYYIFRLIPNNTSSPLDLLCFTQELSSSSFSFTKINTLPKHIEVSKSLQNDAPWFKHQSFTNKLH
jgi:hypothetical protein